MVPSEGDMPALNRETVIAAAIDLLDAAGADALTMRALADRLHVKAASLYWHLRDKDQLLESVTEAMLDRVRPSAAHGSWRAGVEATCAALELVLSEHRAVAAVVLSCLPAVQRSRLVRDLTVLLDGAGLDAADSAAFALVVETAAVVVVTPRAAQSAAVGTRTLAIDSGSWRVAVRAAPPGAVDVARSVGGGAAASIDVREDGVVVVRNRRGARRGAVELSREETWQVKVHGGTWNADLDLTGLRIAGIELDSGGGKVNCTLPAPVGVVPLRVNSGLVGVVFHRPAGSAACATVQQGSVRVRLDDRSLRTSPSDVRWESRGAAAADDRYEMTVYSGCVKVTLDASAPAAPPPAPLAISGRPGLSPAGTGGVGLLLDGIEARLAR